MLNLQVLLQAESRRSLGEAVRQVFCEQLGAQAFLLVGGAPLSNGRIAPIVVSANFTQSVLAELHATAQIHSVPLMEEWLNHQFPMTLTLENTHPRALSPITQVMKENGARTLATHGCFDLRGSSAIYLVLVNVPDSQMINASSSLQVSLPLMQAALGAMRHRSRKKHYDEVNALSTREAEVLQYARKGMTNRQISELMGLSFSTIKNHMANIARKLGVKNRTASVAATSQNFLVSRFGDSTIPPY